MSWLNAPSASVLRTLVLGHSLHIRWSPTYAECLFFDGTKAKALSEVTDEKIRLAERTAYTKLMFPGSNPGTRAHLEAAVTLMDWEHDVMHTLLARARDLDTSPTLWMVAHREQLGTEAYNAPEAKQQRMQEEEEVLALQYFLNVMKVQGEFASVLAALDAEFSAETNRRSLMLFLSQAWVLLRR